MDVRSPVHSRHLQFNKRVPKSGPSTLPVRFMEPSPRPDNIPKQHRSSKSSKGEKYHKDIYLAFVNNALEQKAIGNSETYDDLVNQFNPTANPSEAPASTSQLRLWILALSHVISRLERPHNSLVEAIVNMPWTTKDNMFVKSYILFIGMLLSAKPEYLSLVLTKITQGFTHQSGLQALDARVPESSSSPLTRRTVYDRLHYLLQHILSLIPTLPSTLQPLLVRNFPHKRQNQASQVTYIRNLLRITEYCPELDDRILATIIDRTIQIDVEIQVELEELDNAEEAQDGDIFELDPFDLVVGEIGETSDSGDSDEEGDSEDNLSDISSDAGDLNDSTPALEIPADAQHIREMVRKLDAILKVLFDHFNDLHAVTAPTILHNLPTSVPSTPRSDSPPSILIPELSSSTRSESSGSAEQGKHIRRSQFNILLSIFDRTIIRTFKSRYTQFLVFWYSSLDPEFSDLFQGLLVSKALLEQDQPSVTRAAAASYIASFVSRAEFIDREGARRVTSILCTFLRNHLDAFDAMAYSGAAAQNMAHHSVFYAVTQAVFLIFCFRWRDLEEGPEDVDELLGANSGKKWMSELEIMQRVIASPLNPLKVCSANVVTQFARVAHATDFVYCYSILKDNRRSEYNNNNMSNSRSLQDQKPAIQFSLLVESIHTDLNSFFPFDPYRLPRSSSYIEGVYREWSSVAIDDEDDEDQDDEDSDGVVEMSTNAFDIPQINATDETGELGHSFEGMSISPSPNNLSMSIS